MEDSEKKSVQVTTYLPKEVLDQLRKWMDDNYQRSVSQPVSLIVEHFLKKDGRPLGNTDLAPKVAALEEENLPPRLGRVCKLITKVGWQQLSTSPSSFQPVFHSEWLHGETVSDG